MKEKLIIRDDIILCLLKKEDAKILFETVQENNTHLRKWLPWLDDDKSVEDLESYIQGSCLRFQNQEGVDWLIWEGKKLIGGVALDPLNMTHRKTSLMYWLTQEMEGKGIMTDVLKVLIPFIFKNFNLNRIEICCATGNEKSKNIPQKLGFTYEGISRQSEWLYDHFEDLEVYSLLATESTLYE